LRNISDKSCRENLDTDFVLNNFFSLENRDVYEIMWESIVEGGYVTNDNMAYAHCMLGFLRVQIHGQ